MFPSLPLIKTDCIFYETMIIKNLKDIVEAANFCHCENAMSLEFCISMKCTCCLFEHCFPSYSAANLIERFMVLIATQCVELSCVFLLHAEDKIPMPLLCCTESMLIDS